MRVRTAELRGPPQCSMDSVQLGDMAKVADIPRFLISETQTLE